MSEEEISEVFKRVKKMKEHGNSLPPATTFIQDSPQAQ